VLVVEVDKLLLVLINVDEAVELLRVVSVDAIDKSVVIIALVPGTVVEVVVTLLIKNVAFIK
jgi:hypothetical protein